MAFRIELWDQARLDLDCLSDREAAQFRTRLEKLASAAGEQALRVGATGAQFVRMGVGEYQVRLRLNWSARALEVTSMIPEEDD